MTHNKHQGKVEKSKLEQILPSAFHPGSKSTAFCVFSCLCPFPPFIPFSFYSGFWLFCFSLALSHTLPIHCSVYTVLNPPESLLGILCFFFWLYNSPNLFQVSTQKLSVSCKRMCYQKGNTVTVSCLRLGKCPLGKTTDVYSWGPSLLDRQNTEILAARGALAFIFN